MARYGWIGLAVSFILAWSRCACLWGRPTTPQEAERVVAGWLKADPTPLGTSLGRHVRKVETLPDGSGEPLYYIVYLQPSGFVIVPADDLVEPIIGFVQGDRFDPSLNNPLGALVTNDLNGRIAAVRTGSGLRIMSEEPLVSEMQAKWSHLTDLASALKDKDTIAIMASGIPAISDIRVAPLVKSRWGQRTVSNLGWITVGNDCPLACYNYYTPPFTTPDGDPCNYPCGCSATALAQVMRYHQYPTTGIGVHEFTIWSNGVEQRASTRGGDGSGGPYKWDLMPYEPNCDATEAQRQAVGALCYDAGISVNMGYSAGGSGADTRNDKYALTTIFKYGNAVVGYNNEGDIGRGLIGMINPNLDAKHPVILEVYPGGGGHDIVCDGYGYNSSTLYHHVNMGWLGIDDAWYNLPNIDPRIRPIQFTYVRTCIYNIHVTKVRDGEIISGRVLDHKGEPMANVVLYAKTGSEIVAETETDSQGIYAFDCLQSNSTYIVNAVLTGYGFNTQEVTTGISKDNSMVSGNVWGVDFVGLLCDFNSDQKVDIEDLVMLIEHWGKDDPSFDIAPAPLGDGIVDLQDLEVLMSYWDQEVKDPTLIARWKLDEASGMMAADSGGTNNGTLVGDPIWQPAGGKLGGALQLDGVDDCVTMEFLRDPSEGAVSVFAWVKGGAPGQVIVSQVNGASWLMAGASDGALATELKSSGRTGKALKSAVSITDGAWHRVGLVWDGSNRILYVDGAEVAKDAQSNLAASTGGLYIGGGSSLAPGTFWSGLIDDVRLYNRVVTP